MCKPDNNNKTATFISSIDPSNQFKQDNTNSKQTI